MHTVTESIFSGKNIIVPLADVQHIETHNPRGLIVVTKHTRWDSETGNCGKRILDRCRDRVMVPTKFCMNLAATVNVILYDRMAKAGVVND